MQAFKVSRFVKAGLAMVCAGVMAAAPMAQAAEKSPYWQCVTFARSITGMQIFGDAWTWWEKASGKYDKGQAPQAGAVLVFQPTGKMRVGHVAVVSQVVTDRIIQITHANWSPINGRRGQVEKDVTVVDVSDKGDWSKVKVWYGPINDLGTSVYPTYGFIYAAAQKGQNIGQSLTASIAETFSGNDKSSAENGPVPYEVIKANDAKVAEKKAIEKVDTRAIEAKLLAANLIDAPTIPVKKSDKPAAMKTKAVVKADAASKKADAKKGDTKSASKKLADKSAAKPAAKSTKPDAKKAA
ncbi:CHAP domain-containing protein [Asticcacaulis sp. ZE23SCel15]|uniref:CHAP domain-containing protein n=1 Tax=Asticcacaulis sp. ZE23SCel15 TaxID=3059027 RepID=UPI00265F047C|nr:CHAP domain-containing protein [Asticcacaulis sp. ZE23SCel15]WKL57750.1 CHAP domain-containing protein [Asticcacaulis sp. ZE23SCel15]